jgi:hypothetical protein
VQADPSLDVEAVRAAGARPVRVDAACALALVEHRTDDVARDASLALGGRKAFDARVDLGANGRSERIEALAQQVPLGAHHARDLGEMPAARVAAASARPPVALAGGRASSPVDVVVEGEELLSHARRSAELPHFAVSTHAPA